MSWDRVWTAVRVTIIAFLLVGMGILARTTALGEPLAGVARTLGDLADRSWAPFAYVALYAAAISIGLPGTAMTLVGGAAFGLWKGLIINLVGATLGAAGAFTIGRTVGRELIERLLGKHLHRLQFLETDRAAFFTFLRLRLTPIVPYNMLNFAAGLTKSRLLPFLCGTFFGILPSTFLFTYFATALVAGGEARSAALLPIALALAGLLLFALAPTIVRSVRRRA